MISVEFPQVSIAYRFSREVQSAENAEFTETQLNAVQAELEKELPQKMADEIANILSKLTTGSEYTADDKFKTYVSLNVAFVSIILTDALIVVGINAHDA